MYVFKENRVIPVQFNIPLSRSRWKSLYVCGKNTIYRDEDANDIHPFSVRWILSIDNVFRLLHSLTIDDLFGRHFFIGPSYLSDLFCLEVGLKNSKICKNLKKQKT